MLGSMKISFSGWALGIYNATIRDGATLDVVDTNGMCVSEVVAKINAGDWSISLTECLDSCRKSEVEIFGCYVEVDE